MTDSSKVFDGTRILTKIGAVILAHLLILSTANADSSSSQADSRASKLEDVWKPLSEYRHLRYISHENRSNKENVTAIFNGTDAKRNGHRDVTDRNTIACIVKTRSNFRNMFNSSARSNGLKGVLDCFLVLSSDQDSSWDTKPNPRGSRMINTDSLNNESYQTYHGNSYSKNILNRLLMFKETLENVLRENVRNISELTQNSGGPPPKENAITIYSFYKEGNNLSYSKTFKVNKNKMSKDLIDKLVSTSNRKDESAASGDPSCRNPSNDKSKLKVIMTKTKEGDHGGSLLNKELKHKINVQIIKPNTSDDVDIEDGHWSKVVVTMPKTNEFEEPVETENGTKPEDTIVNPDLGILKEFLTNSLSDLRSPGPEFHNHQVIVSGPVHGSLDDLILHHTSSSGANRPQSSNDPLSDRPRPSVILIHDVPEALLPKPPPNYHPTTPIYQYDPPRPEPNPVHVQINNYPAPTASNIYRPHTPIPEPEPEYVPVIYKPKPVYSYKPSKPNIVQHQPPIHHYQKPVSDSINVPDHDKPHRPNIKPVYHDQQYENVPIYVGTNSGHKPGYYDPKPEPDHQPKPPLYRPVHYDPVPEPEPIYGPGSRPPLYKPVHYDPIPEPDHGPGTRPPLYKPVHYDPAPEPEPVPGTRPPLYKPAEYNPVPEPAPEPVQVPVYLYPKPEPDNHSVYRPVYSTTMEPTPKPADPYVTTSAYLPPPASVSNPQIQSGGLKPNTPLGPTLIFVDTTPATPVRPADPPVPSPLNPLTIPSGKPPPSIVLLPPLSDQPSLQSAACPPIIVTNNQNIVTSADFKDNCPSNVNVIINAPVSATAGDVMPINSEDYEDPDAVEDSGEEGENDSEPSNDQGGGGSTALIVPAPIPVAPVAGAGALGAAGAAAGAPLGGGAVLGAGAPVAAAAGAGAGSVTQRPTQNDPIQSAVSPTPTKRPQSVSQSMSIWDYIGSVFNSLVLYPLWTIVFGPFSLLVASGLGVATLVFPWAFPRFWFGRRRRKRRMLPTVEFKPIVSSPDYSALIFESRLKRNYDFHEDYNR